ncbi:MAG: 5'-methylthioadenosine/S-adenosylhomocysteine nucleosidase [Chloroflexota bacterium]|nr:5'-methylthioadenosine/S-adenosylhomocysteine nucleosidase [Chloroflexota bacterium]
MNEPTPNSNPLIQGQGPIGIIVAMDAELRHLLERFPVTPRQDGDQHTHELTIGDTPVVACRSGMGMVSAAAATARLILQYQPRAILNFGCAGAHTREIAPGDVVIGSSYVNHGAVHILPNGEEHYAGFAYEVGREAMTPKELPANADLLDFAHRMAADWSPESWPPDLGWPSEIPYRRPRVHTGPVASADIWTQAHARLDLLHARHGTLCEDMEAAAIAQVCAPHRTPFLAVKDISNNEFHGVTDIPGGFPEFPTAEVGKRAAALIERMLLA